MTAGRYLHKVLLALLALVLVGIIVGGCANQTSALPNAALAAPLSAIAQPATASQPALDDVVTTIKPIKLRFHSYTLPPPGASGIAAQYFMGEVTRRSNGAVTWDIYWSSALSDSAGQLDLAAKGAVDVSKTCILYFPEKFPIGHFEYSFPFPPNDPIMVTKAKRQIYDEFPAKRAEYDRNHVVMLANTVCGYYELLSKVPIRSITDMHQRRVGMIGRYFGRWLEPVGAKPLVTPAADLYTALQSGIIDQSLTWLDLSYSLSVHQQAKYLIESGFGSFLAEDVLFGKDKFDTLQPELQRILLEAGKDSELWAAEYQKAHRDEIIPAMAKTGITVIKLPEAERAKWASMVDDIPAEWAAEATKAGAPGWEIAKRWQAITTEMGYQWPKQWAVKK